LIQYPQQTELNGDYIRKKIEEFILEDLPSGDITTAGTVNNSSKSTAVIQAQDDLVFAGAMIVPYFFDESFNIEMLQQDGDFVKNGTILFKVSGKTSHILSVERVMLNLLQRLSGIATMTRKYVEIAKLYGVKILDTRKTTPGLRLFEKYAVTVGGGTNHRLDLSSGILIKDNHIKAAGSIKKAIEIIRQINYDKPVEVEVENFEELQEGLSAGADGFLLDNMSPEKIIKAVEIIRMFPNGEQLFVEASGGINLSNLKAYVSTGVNAISTGAITHSVKAANIHLEFL